MGGGVYGEIIAIAVFVRMRCERDVQNYELIDFFLIRVYLMRSGTAIAILTFESTWFEERQNILFLKNVARVDHLLVFRRAQDVGYRHLNP
jgi:hypothetical protein